MNTKYDFHPLTVKVKDYFAGDADNAFTKRLNNLIAIDSVETFPNEPDDVDAIFIFGQNDNHLSCIVFANGLAWIECVFEDKIFNIPFYYSLQSNKQNNLPAGGTWLGVYSIYENYESKGKEKLFDDILALVESIILNKVNIEYLGNGKQMFIKSRVYLYPNDTIAYTEKWKYKYIKAKKLKSIQL